MRYFFSTGEASGELNAVLLARAIETYDPAARFEGIGAERMTGERWTRWRNHTGWASMGPLAAIPRIPPLLATMWRTALHLAQTKPELIVLIDFGAFNMRLAKTLRTRLRYEAPIMYLFPPATWLDNEGVARAVGTMTVPVTAFAHQYEFYKSLRLPIMFFGHPLASQYEQRPPRPAPPLDGGTIAVLPGSRAGELRYHVPALLAALRILRATRPKLRAIFGAASAQGERAIARAVKRERLENVTIVRGVATAVADADAAFVASGTAVLETVLAGVPSIAVYIVNPMVVGYGRRMQKRIAGARFITLPNLVLERELVPELLQDDATPEALAAAMEAVLLDPSHQYAQFAEVRQRLGPTNALDDCAKFAVALAQAGQR
jgi:lipid-A-disaccharide synthase